VTIDRDELEGSGRGNPDGAPKKHGRGALFYAVLLLLAAALAVGIYLLAGRGDEHRETPDSNVAAADPRPGPEKEFEKKAEPASDAQLARAFEAAFGKAGQAQLTTYEETRIYRPSRLLRAGDKLVLLSEGKNVSDCHACSGAVAIHYMREEGGRYSVVGSWPALIPGNGWGNPPDWSVSNSFSANPTVSAEIGYTAQGCTSGGVVLTELRPDKPVRSELIPTHYDNQSGMGELNGQRIRGRIDSVRKDGSFEVAYLGARAFLEKWIKKGDSWQPEGGESKMPQC
jgi:hypothetical protein